MQSRIIGGQTAQEIVPWQVHVKEQHIFPVLGKLRPDCGRRHSMCCPKRARVPHVGEQLREETPRNLTSPASEQTPSLRVWPYASEVSCFAKETCRGRAVAWGSSLQFH